ncbi:MAG: type II toxin-antitoxin system HicA family toxin [Candidatus Aenigmarchaeota archaeon]|nr:type II toxin-antitoxin system HicA family toxin [Candidatus Aenigmarchaeota archaeon]
MPIAIDKLLKILQKTGFQPVRQTGGHLIMHHPNGRSIPVPIHGRKQIDPHMLGEILKQAGITREEFFKLLKEILILLGIVLERPKRDAN